MFEPACYYFVKQKDNIIRLDHDKGKGRLLAIIDDSILNFQIEIFKNMLAHLESKNCIAKTVFVICQKKLTDKSLASIVEKIKPDSIIFFGNQFVNFLDESISKFNLGANSIFLFGRIVPYNFNGKTINGIFTASWHKVNEESKKTFKNEGNLLGFLFRHLELAILNKNFYTAKSISEYSLKFIKTIDQFDDFMKSLETKPIVSIDTEGINLNRKFDNQLISIQFFAGGKTVVFLPLYHKETPFSNDQIDYIKKKLAVWFTKGQTKFLIFQNAKFDLTQIRRELNIDYIGHDIYDISNGEFFLDENRKFLRNANIYNNKDRVGAYSLFAMALQYGSFDYIKGELKKSDRANMAAQPLNNIAEYSVKDCFDGNTFVQTDKGPLKIKEIIKINKKPKVLSFNHKTKKVEYKPILDVWRKKRKNDMCKLKFSNNSLLATKDHKIWCENRKKYVKISDLKKDDIVLVQEKFKVKDKSYILGRAKFKYEISKKKHTSLQAINTHKANVKRSKLSGRYHPKYSTYHHIISRCYNKKDPRYKDYGARGITVCKEWKNNIHSFLTWCDNNCPNTLMEIDRKNNNKGYNPKNCRFVTPSQNSRNRRSTVFVSYKGKNQKLIDLIETHAPNLSYNTVYNRIFRSKISVEKALKSDNINYVKVVGVFKSKKQPKYVYDISIKDNHNLFVSESKTKKFVLAHNCVIPYQIAKFQLQEAARRGSQYDNFKKTVLCVGGSMSHVFSDMEFNGAFVDQKYMSDMLQKESPFLQQLNEMEQGFNKFDSVESVNQMLIKGKLKGIKKTLFGKEIKTKLFNPNKVDHLEMLFSGVLGLRPLGYRKDGKGATFNKKFLIEYSNTVAEVEHLREYRKLRVLLNTYFKGLLKSITKNPDSQDHRLRAQYNFLDIVTSRSSARKPSLQNIPSRDKVAKFIKRIFIASKDCICVDVDFNAHEVRMWGNISNDVQIFKAFGIGVELRRQVRILFNSDPKLHEKIVKHLHEIKWKEIKDINEKQKIIDNSRYKKILQSLLDLETKGDIHRTNYELFYNVPAHLVTDEQRTSVKAVAFGTIYDKSSASLGPELYASQIKKALEKANFDENDPEYVRVVEKAQERAQKIIDKMFDTFKQGKKWIDKTHDNSEKDLYVVSPLGVVRHLYGHLSIYRPFRAMMNRRGPNSVIQGTSSNLGYIGARELQSIMYELKTYGIDLKFKHVNFVHDALKTEAGLKMLPLSLYYLEHAMTTLIYKKVRDTFGWSMPLVLEMGTEIGACGSRTAKWDFTLLSLLNILDSEISWLNSELKYNLDKEEIIKAVKHNWKIVNPYRLKELKEMKGYHSSDNMLLTPKIASKQEWMQ